ncbi:hypothetical protein BDO18943_05082 [Burkholderia dolosa]|nr:hypothetical protein BDO18943_05082 [Burkholderia dolosa]
MRAQRIEIADQPRGVVVAQAAARRRRTGAALVDQHDMGSREIEAAQHRGPAAAAGPAVQHDDGLTERVAGFEPRDRASVAGQAPANGGR